MKKLTAVVAIILIAGLLAGCWLFNQAPIITSDPITVAKWNIEYIYKVEATDPNDDTMNYSLTVSPEGMAIDPDTGVIEWKPSLSQLGSNDVTVEVSDGKKSAIQSFVVVVSLK